MSLTVTKARFFILGLISYFLGGCYHPPYNNFKPDSPIARTSAGGAAVGAAVGAVTSSTLAGTAIGGVAGGAVGALVGLRHDSKPYIIKELKKRDIQYIEYGDTMTLIIPTDKYYLFNSPRLNEIRYPGLAYIIKLLKLYPQSPIYVAGFTDNVGSKQHKRKLSQAQAETMMTYLWSNNIPSRQLKAEGYADKFDISNNKLIHGSAQNRRVEIQWIRGKQVQPQVIPMTK